MAGRSVYCSSRRLLRVVAVAAFEDAEGAVFYFDDAVDKAVEEVAVVGDDDDVQAVTVNQVFYTPTTSKPIAAAADASCRSCVAKIRSIAEVSRTIRAVARCSA